MIFNDDLDEAYAQLATVARRALAGQSGNGSGSIAGPVTLVAEEETPTQPGGSGGNASAVHPGLPSGMADLQTVVSSGCCLLEDSLHPHLCKRVHERLMAVWLVHMVVTRRTWQVVMAGRVSVLVDTVHAQAGEAAAEKAPLLPAAAQDAPASGAASTAAAPADAAPAASGLDRCGTTLASLGRGA